MLIGIVGTSGKGQTLSAEDFDHMVNQTRKTIREQAQTNAPVHLVSGGCSWADHVAVMLYLEKSAQNLTLHLPCTWTGTQFTDCGGSNWAQNPGRTLNTYHARFSRVIGRNSLMEIQEAINLGAEVTVSSGFHARNTLISAVPLLIALG